MEKIVKETAIIGKVVSNRMDKTVVVTVESSRLHPLYHKRIKRVSRRKVHDEKNICKVGDLVKIAETRPLSKEKKWRVVEVVGKGLVVDIKEVEGVSS